MTTRRALAPIAAIALAVSISGAFAQGFPAPLPNQQPAAGASPFPPVNGSAPAASVGIAPSAFPSSGAAPLAGAPGGPPPAAAGAGSDCEKGFVPLRNETERRGQLIKAASERKAPPDEACKLIGAFSSAELKMLKFVETNSQKCGIPPQIADQLRKGHSNTEAMHKKVCAVAQQVAQQPRGPAGPSLSEVLGSSAALPEATKTKRGGSTFDTLNGNVLTR